MSRYTQYFGKNNVSSKLAVGISSIATTIQVEAGEGELWGTDFPILGTLEHRDSTGKCTKREIVKVVSKSTDSFTVVRKFAPCPVSDDSISQSAVSSSFDPGDTFSIYIPYEILNAVSEAITDLYNNGNDRLFLKKTSGLGFEITPGNVRFESGEAYYPGGTGTVNDNATNYVMLDSSFNIIVETTELFDVQNISIAEVVAVNGEITQITTRKIDGIAGRMGGGGDPIYGDGSDGDLVISENTILNAGQTYNFSNLTICSGAVLSFSGTGCESGPIIKVANQFINEGCIDMSNFDIVCACTYRDATSFCELSNVLKGMNIDWGAGGTRGTGTCVASVLSCSSYYRYGGTGGRSYSTGTPSAGNGGGAGVNGGNGYGGCGGGGGGGYGGSAGCNGNGCNGGDGGYGGNPGFNRMCAGGGGGGGGYGGNGGNGGPGRIQVGTLDALYFTYICNCPILKVGGDGGNSGMFGKGGTGGRFHFGASFNGSYGKAGRGGDGYCGGDGGNGGITINVVSACCTTSLGYGGDGGNGYYGGNGGDGGNTHAFNNWTGDINTYLFTCKFPGGCGGNGGCGAIPGKGGTGSCGIKLMGNGYVCHGKGGTGGKGGDGKIGLYSLLLKAKCFCNTGYIMSVGAPGGQGGAGGSNRAYGTCTNCCGRGGNGGAGGNGSAGGNIIIITNCNQSNGTVSVAGGVGGTGGAGGTGFCCGNGTAGANGSNGTSGCLQKFILKG